MLSSQHVDAEASRPPHARPGERAARGQNETRGGSSEPLVDPLPVGSTLERVFSERAVRLPEAARRALVVAAVSSPAQVEPIVEALRLLELDEHALELPEDAGLVAIEGGRVGFRHSLVRSAAVHGAAASERRRAHRALARGAGWPI